MLDLADLRKCTKCGEMSPPREFYGKNHWCRSCKKAYAKKWREGNLSHREKVREWRIANRERVNSARRFRRARGVNGLEERLWEKYKITLEFYREMQLASGGCCAICRKPTDALCVDHDHKTGQVRELLCRACNQGIGCFLENPAIMEAAIAYVRKHGEL